MPLTIDDYAIHSLLGLQIFHVDDSSAHRILVRISVRGQCFLEESLGYGDIRQAEALRLRHGEAAGSYASWERFIFCQASFA